MIDIDIAEQLFPNPLTMITQLLATFVLFYFVCKFLWNPAREMIKKRSEFVQKELDEASNSKNEALKDRELASQEIKNAKAIGKDIIDKAYKEASDVKEEMLKKAKDEANDTLEKARNEIARERVQMRKDMVNEMVDVAMSATCKLIGDKVDASDDQKAIEKFVKEVNEL